MDKNGLKKMGAVASAVVIVLAFLSIPVMYIFVGAPFVFVAVTFILLLAVGILMMYYVHERIGEIDGGLEDDLDNY